MTDNNLTTTLYALTSVIDNLIINHKNNEFKQGAKFHFNRLTHESKRLNSIVNKTLKEADIEGFDLYSDEIMSFVLNLSKKLVGSSE